MKTILGLLLVALAMDLRAADTVKTDSSSESTNAPVAKKSELATIPDATHKPVLTTNTVTIAGQHVTYVAETGMLPILKPDGTSSASVFYVAYTRTGETEHRHAARHVLFQRRSGFVFRVAASRRARSAPREDERRRHPAETALQSHGQPVFDSGRQRSGFH